MSIKKFEVFGLKRILIYGGVNLFVIGGSILALIRNYITTSTGIPVGGLITMFCASMFVLIPTIILYRARKAFNARIKAYTPDGTAIIPDYVTQPPLSTMTADIGYVEVEIINFWAGKLQKSIFIFLDYLNGGTMGFTKDLIDLETHRPTGPLLVEPGFHRWAVGETSGNWSCVQYSGNLAEWPQALNRIRHETGHKCLSAANVPDEQHHDYMKRHGFQY